MFLPEARQIYNNKGTDRNRHTVLVCVHLMGTSLLVNVTSSKGGMMIEQFTRTGNSSSWNHRRRASVGHLSIRVLTKAAISRVVCGESRCFIEARGRGRLPMLRLHIGSCMCHNVRSQLCGFLGEMGDIMLPCGNDPIQFYQCLHCCCRFFGPAGLSFISPSVVWRDKTIFLTFLYSNGTYLTESTWALSNTWPLVTPNSPSCYDIHAGFLAPFHSQTYLLALNPLLMYV